MRQFNCVTIEYFKEQELLFWKIKDTGMPNFCLDGLREFREFAIWVKEYFSHPDRPLKFIVSASEHDGIYNMGGDLPFFLKNIKTKNVENLTTYAHLCIDAIYNIYTSFGLPVISVALVEGNAYGGGFECALAHDFIITEEKVQFCLPENKFNLFPGMGAYSLLYRKLNAIDVNSIIKSGRIYKARYLQSLGLIEELAEKGTALVSLHLFIKRITENFNFEYHHIQCKKSVFPLEKEELLKVTDLWVEACMKINTFDLRKMEILINAQSRKAKVEI
ncbi:DSF synthase [Aquimarina sp. EL_43]|uniref:crotonase/enoyl-CoA hydratase family protein n=1 Tax=Aquimarina TaxID=290174 RepID=UPI00046FB9E0|nr:MULTISPECIES: crotonase/enoyl-CoA hydratase family protein [Aquimarina]MBG6130205.1 DSF synthase [Aquimarina sp. EL_35]MBG6148985.1 DSF synthase [Aquimarina sp. EL_32]MBG6168641.1 DSF synthase [Aquimarina sp. EL_43]